MAKQCPDCRTVTQDDIGYCPACGGGLANTSQPARLSRALPLLAALAATGSIAASLLYIWQNQAR